MNANNPELKSFISVSRDSHFPIQNLPYGVFRKKNSPDNYIGVAIGDSILNLTILEAEGYLKNSDHSFQHDNLNGFLRLGKDVWHKTRQQISALLRHDNPQLRDNSALRDKVLCEQNDVKMQLPAKIGDYTDFYSSEEHARNVGSIFRDKNNPLLPNWKHLPVGYHGRASSVVVSGTEIHRPKGQIKYNDRDAPVVDRCAKLDFELELAFIIGKDSQLGRPVSIDNAGEHIFGLVLMNDWSARDIQKWEYVPLGPFVSKSFATSISPWVVPLEALDPFKIDSKKQIPEPQEYLKQAIKGRNYDINFEILLSTQKGNHEKICETNSRFLYWSMAQQLAHHTITGCNISVGDLMASGTISGEDDKSYGSLLELSWNGEKPIKVGNEQRTFLEDYDQVEMTGWAQGEGYKIGFGNVEGTIIPSL